MQNKLIISILSIFVLIDILLIYLALTISPIKLKRNCFTYEYGESISTKVEDYVNANPSILESVKLNIKNVSTEVGKYQASIQYFDEVYPFEIEVVDTIKPKVQLKQVEIHIDVGEIVKAKKLIKKIEDQSKTTVYFYDDKTKEKVKQKAYNAEGSYIERIVVEDSHKNQSAALRVKIVVSSDHVLPRIEGIYDIEIVMGSYFDPMNGVRATDDTDGDITSRVVVDGIVDTQQVGEYSIIYRVSDAAGNVKKVTRKVIVIE